VEEPWRLDEQEPVDEQWLVEAGGEMPWMNSHRWRLEEVDGGWTVARGGWSEAVDGG